MQQQHVDQAVAPAERRVGKEWREMRALPESRGIGEDRMIWQEEGGGGVTRCDEYEDRESESDERRREGFRWRRR